MRPDVVIIGGGVIGLTTAYCLAKENVRVAIVDRGPPGREASWAGAGIIPPLARNSLNPLETLRQHSIHLFPKLSRELLDRTGIDNEFHTCGGVEYISDAQHLDRFRDANVPFDTFPLATEGQAFPVAPTNAPRLAVKLAYSQVRNPRHLAALIEACRQLDVRFETMPIEAGQTLIAAGAWSQQFLPPEYQQSIFPVRGQIVLFKPASPVLSHIIIDGHRYLVPRRDGRVLVGSTEEPEAGFEKANTIDEIRNLVTFAKTHVPALADAEIEKTWSGLRPGSGDGWPYLGPIPERNNQFIAAGHFRAGLQLSAATGEFMTRMLLGQSMPEWFHAFRVDRPKVDCPTPLFRS